MYVETPQEKPDRINRRDADALQENIRLAETLGATVVRVKADRPSDGLIAFAQREGVTHVIFGQSARTRRDSSGAARRSTGFSGPFPTRQFRSFPYPTSECRPTLVRSAPETDTTRRSPACLIQTRPA